MIDKLTKKEIAILATVAFMILSGFICGLLSAWDIWKLEYSLGELEKALLEKCDTWNIAIWKEQADWSVDVQYVRVCKEDYEALSTIISK